MRTITPILLGANLDPRCFTLQTASAHAVHLGKREPAEPCPLQKLGTMKFCDNLWDFRLGDEEVRQWAFSLCFHHGRRGSGDIQNISSTIGQCPQ